MKHVLCVFLLSALPVFATISQRQSSVYQWNSGSSYTCSAMLGSGYMAGDLIVAWTFWNTGSSANGRVPQVRAPVLGDNLGITALRCKTV
jgi:hypothetical protein